MYDARSHIHQLRYILHFTFGCIFSCPLFSYFGFSSEFECIWLTYFWMVLSFMYPVSYTRPRIHGRIRQAQPHHDYGTEDNLPPPNFIHRTGYKPMHGNKKPPPQEITKRGNTGTRVTWIHTHCLLNREITNSRK